MVMIESTTESKQASSPPALIQHRADFAFKLLVERHGLFSERIICKFFMCAFVNPFTHGCLIFNAAADRKYQGVLDTNDMPMLIVGFRVICKPWQTKG